jgi:glucosamine--fructose-6-phosphate aminotransferase (isomerizing)
VQAFARARRNDLAVTLGAHLEREILEQPAVWERLAAGGAFARMAAECEGEIVLAGSGSSLHAAELGALALRARGVRAQALAATEAQRDHVTRTGRTVIAISQSGRSSDLLAALDVLRPARIVALTNSADSPLAARAAVTIDVDAGTERAIPATKSVTATVAVLLGAACALDGADAAPPLRESARAVRAWLGGGTSAAVAAAAHLASRRDVVVLGTHVGVPVAREGALKFKESTYLHAEGFAAGEFRHGSAAMVDERTAVLGIADGRSGVVERPLREARARGALCYGLGAIDVEGIERLGPDLPPPFEALGWIVTLQVLALHAARDLGIDSDLPRGLRKALVNE